MSDLQIGLVLLGVALIVVVLLFNWWQDRRVRRQMKTQFPQVDNDPLMAHEANERKEPSVEDRKSTRLNSSHVAISYAVFCLKKKNDRRTDESGVLSDKPRAP